MAEKKTRYTLEAEDQFSRVLGDFKRQLNGLSGELNQLQKSFGFVGDAVAALLAGFSAVALKNTFDQFVKFRESLEEMRATTGASVTSLSVLSQAARLSGTDMGTVEAALVKMTKGLSASNAETKDTARALEYLGITAKDASGHLRDPGDVMLDIAKRLATMEDGANKTALALALWGKAGAANLPVMKALAETGDLVAQVTADQARQAHEYEVALTRFKVASEEAGKVVMNELVQPLTALYVSLTNAITGSDGLAATLKKLKEDGTLNEWIQGGINAFTTFSQAILILGANVKFVFETIGRELARFAVNVQLVATGQWAASKGLREVFDKDSEQARAALDAWEKKIMELGSTYQKVLSQVQQAPRESLRALEWHMANPDAAFHGTDHPSTDNAYQTELASLDEKIAKLRGIGELEAYEMKLQEDRFAKITPKQKQELLDKEKQLIQLEQEKKLREEQLKSDIEMLNTQQRLIDLEASYRDEARQRISDMEFQNSLIGKSAEEVSILTENRRIDLDLQKRLAEVTKDTGDDLTADQLAQIQRLTDIAALEKAGIANSIARGKAARDEISVWDDLAGHISNMFSEMADGGKRAIDVLRSELKSLLKDLVALFAKRWILQLGALALGGTTAGGALASQAAALGQGTLTGALGSVLSGAGTGFGGAFGTGALTAGGDFVGTGLAGMAGNIALATGATDAFAATVAAAVPVIGWIVGIGGLLYSVFGHRGGGPKAGGSFFGSFDSSGALAGDITGTIDRNQHLHNETQLDSTAQQMTTSLAATIASTITQLGGHGQAFQVGVGFNSDPSGTAPSMASTLLRDASGHTLLEQTNRNVSRDDGALQAEITLQGQRALLAALQASDFPQQIKDILNSATAESASAADIQRILAAAMDMRTVLDNIGSVSLKGLSVDSLRAWQREGETLTQTLQRVGSALSQFDDSFMTDSQRLTVAQQQLSSAFSDLGIAMPASTEDFYNLVHSIDVSTASGRHMLEVLLQVAPAFQQVQNAASAALQQFYSLASGLNSSFGSSYARMNFDAAVSHWRAVSGTPADFDVEGFLRNMISTGSFGQNLAFIQSLGDQGLPTFNAMLAAYSQWQQTLQQTSSSGGALPTLTSGIGDLGNAAGAAADQMQAAKQSIRGYLDSLFLNTELSALSPQDRLAAARSQFQTLLSAAQSGDAGAMSQLSGASDAYLRVAREMFASGSAYTAIFGQVTGALAGVSGYTGGAGAWTTALTTALPSGSTLASQADIAALTRAVVAALGGVAAANDESVQSQTTALQGAVKADPARR